MLTVPRHHARVSNRVMETDKIVDEIRTLRDEILVKVPTYSSGEAISLASFLTEQAHPEINWDRVSEGVFQHWQHAGYSQPK